MEGREHGIAEGGGRKASADGGLSGLAHALREWAIFEEAKREGAEFGGIVREEAADAVFDGRSGVAITEDGKSGGHGFERGGVVAVLEQRMGGVNEEAMALEDLLEFTPIAGGLDGGKFGIAADESDGEIREGSLMKIPEQGLRSAKYEIGDAQAGGEFTLPGNIVGGVHTERNDVIGEAPGAAFEFGDGNYMGCSALDVTVHGVAEFSGISARVLLEDHAIEGEMDDKEARAGQGLDVEKIGKVVGDDAVVRFT